MEIQHPLTYYHRSGEDFSPLRFARQLRYLVSLCPEYRPDAPILFFCIGSDRVLGDSLGPVIGYKLEQILSDPFQVIGTLSRPIHAVNLRFSLLKLAAFRRSPLLIAIDASVGRRENIGCITLSNQAIYPGTGVSKQLPGVGHISITGIVSEDTIRSAEELQHIRLGLIMEIADCICSGIQSFQQISVKNPALLS